MPCANKSRNDDLTITVLYSNACLKQMLELEPRYNADVGVHKKSVLKQNSVIMRVLYTGSIGTGSQALAMF